MDGGRRGRHAVEVPEGAERHEGLVVSRQEKVGAWEPPALALKTAVCPANNLTDSGGRLQLLPAPAVRCRGAAHSLRCTAVQQHSSAAAF